MQPAKQLSNAWRLNQHMFWVVAWTKQDGYICDVFNQEAVQWWSEILGELCQVQGYKPAMQRDLVMDEHLDIPMNFNIVAKCLLCKFWV